MTDKNKDCQHIYRVTSPIDTVEICCKCGDERPCPILYNDSRFKEGKEPPSDAR